MKKFISVITAVILAVSLAACGSKPTLVGKWMGEQNETVEFFGDGGVVISAPYPSDYKAYMNYTVREGNILEFSSGSEVETCNYEINGNKLILSYYQGGSTEYKRID